MDKRFRSLVAVAVIVAAIVVWFVLRQPPERTGPVDKITLGAYTGDTAALVWIAEDQGFFVENDLEVTIKGYEAGKLAADALLAGEVDVTTSAEFVFVSNAFDHDDLRVGGEDLPRCRVEDKRPLGTLNPPKPPGALHNRRASSFGSVAAPDRCDNLSA